MHSSMPYLIQFVPSFSFFGIFIRDSPPLSNYLLHCRRNRYPRQRKQKKNDNAVKARQGDKIAEKK
jgi:hypothetical protein